MLSEGPKFYQRPMVKKVAGSVFLTTFIGSLVVAAVFRAKEKDD